MTIQSSDLAGVSEMTDRSTALDSVRAFLTDPTDAHARSLSPHLASDVDVSVHTTNEKGREAAISALQGSLFHHVVYGGHWDEPETEGDTVTQLLAMPAKGIAAGCKFKFTFNSQGEIGRIEGGWVLPPAVLTPEPVLLTAAMRGRLNSADKDHMPILFAYVTPEGRPEQMYRSGAYVHGDDQLAFWNPRPDGSFLASIAVKPGVSAIYRHDESHEMLEIAGRARVVDDQAQANLIYDARDKELGEIDPERTGVAVVIDLDRVTGLIHAAETGAIERILMVRAKA